jgi:hypothetical protein
MRDPAQDARSERNPKGNGMNWIDLCNSALLLVGGQTINNLDEPTQEARGCKVFLDQTKSGVLAAHPWNCATSWHVPALVGEAGQNGAPAWPHRYAFALPPDCLRVLRIENGLPTGSLATRAAPPVPFIVARDKERLILCCDMAAPTIVYVADPDNPELLIPALRDVIVFQLAAKLALHLTESRARMEACDQRAQTAMQQAMLVDAREGYGVIPRDDTWLRERAESPEDCF